MRLRRWVIGWCLGLLTIPLVGCATLNEWLEGTVGEEKEKEGTPPEVEMITQRKLLQGDDPAARKAAIGKLVGLKLADALKLVIERTNDADPAVAKEVLSQLQTVTGFAEKTEDERQLDPEGYDQQLAFKKQVVEEGLTQLSTALEREDDGIRYGALIVYYNLGQPPVVPEDAPAQIRDRVGAAIAAVALNPLRPVDARLLAIEVLVNHHAGEQVATLLPLLDDESDDLRARVALALGQAAGWTGVPAEAQTKLLALAGDQSQPIGVRWRAAAALGRLQTANVGGLETPFQRPDNVDADLPINIPELSEFPGLYAPLDAYRSYATAHAKSPEAVKLVAALAQAVDKVATAEEEKLAAERKKGHR